MAIHNVVVTLTVEEIVRMQMILVDRDAEDALKFVQELQQKIEKADKKGMRSHLDKKPGGTE
jgi:ArsR family metal-binding transcriptional regulator